MSDPRLSICGAAPLGRSRPPGRLGGSGDPPHLLTADIQKRFPGGTVIEAKFHLPLDPPGVTVLFGPSGSGKTTVLRCLAGLERPQSGAIRWNGEVWFDAAMGRCLSPQERRVGYLFQEYALFPHLSLRGNVAYGLAHMDAAAREQRAAEMMRLFGLEGLEDRPPRALSGGQQQRAALARALAPSPRLLLLDEPLSALDAPTRARLRPELRRLLLQTGVPSVVVTHDRNEALALGDAMAVIVEGRLRQIGPVEEIFSRPADVQVAESVGVETVLAGRIVEVREGLLEAAVAGVSVLAVDPGSLEGGEVLICIRAEDVMLEADVRRQESARNHFASIVQMLTPEGPLVRVTLDCGFRLAALVTRPASEELGLAPGKRVIAAVKATSIHVIPRATH
jgi:molybdate transport system ATP-binding protein